MKILGTALAILAADLTIKMVVRHRLHRPYAIGSFATIRVVSHALWLSRVRPHLSGAESGLVLLLATVPLYALGTVIPGAQVFAGLAIGGAISNWLEYLRRGRVTDYLELSFWPAFNLADAAMVAGVVGLVLVAGKAVS